MRRVSRGNMRGGETGEKSICLSNGEKKSICEKKSDSEGKTRELVKRFNGRGGRRAGDGEM